MFKALTRSALFLALLSVIVQDGKTPVLDAKQARMDYEAMLAAHPYNQPLGMSYEEFKALPKYDRPDLAWQQDFTRTMDPNLGYPNYQGLVSIINSMSSGPNSFAGIPGSATDPWVERGPNNVAGRTRGIMWDPNDVTGKKVWAGGVTGGLWFNNDITSATTSWNAVNDFWDNIAVTSIAFDPNNTNTMYVGTGEGWGTGSSRGAGVWKSTDGGLTWSQLSSTTDFYYVNDVVVRDESGTSVVYVAVAEHFYQGQFQGNSQGLNRSTNGGTSFTQVMPNVPSTSNPYSIADIELAANGRIWVGTRNNSFGDGGGNILFSDDGTTWTVSETVSGAGRVELACAPSDSATVYALVESGLVLESVLRTTNSGTTWTTQNEPDDADLGIPSTDFTRGQAWYDLIIAVDPNDANTVVAGGIDLFRSTDGATTWDQISKWSNNNLLSTLNCSFVHADQHNVVFKPNSSTEVIFGTDGGVFWTDDLNNAVNNSVIEDRLTDHNVTQFYACAIHPTANNDFFLAGSQDNGTHRFNQSGINSTTEVYGGDGAYCFIDQTDPTFQIASYVYNTYERSSNGGTSFTTNLQNDQNSGSFINPADYDNEQDILYSAFSTTSINRIEDVTGTHSVGQVTISGMGSMASHFSVSPHTTNSTTLFIGTRGGDVYKVTNANTGTPTVTDLTTNNLPNASVSCIELGGSEDSIMLTFFNYGVTNIWYSTDGGTSWVSKEGNLPDMPVRWALFNPTNHNEAIVATELGVWATTNFNASSPTWSASNNGLANVRTDMLQVRTSDNEVIAATYGRGLFSSGGFNSSPGNPPIAAFSATNPTFCAGGSTDFTDQSTGGAATNWAWTFTGGTPGTSTVQNPTGITYATAGTYAVTLVVSNANGSDTLTDSVHITVNALPTVTVGAIPSACALDPAFMLTTGSPSGGTYSGTGVSGGMFDPTVAGVGTHTITYSFTDGNGCTNSNTATVTVNPLPTVAFSSVLAPVCASSVSFMLNVATPAGGMYSGLGVSNNMFDPSIAGPGTHNITYTYTDSVGCTNSASTSQVVDSLPTVTLGAFSAVCANDTAFALTGGSPIGGTYSGTGVSGGFFDPATAGAGTHVITYTFTNTSGCDGQDSSTIVVNALPTVTFSPVSDLCLASPVDTLEEGSPIGGTYSGPGVTGNEFDPAAAGLGTHTLIYTFTDANGCTNSDSTTINVITAPVVTLDSFPVYCENQGPIALSGGSPFGGTYIGPGITNDTLYPDIMGQGLHMVIYEFNAGAGCMGSDTQFVEIAPAPNVTLDTIADVCAGGNPVTLTGGIPAGGTFSGTGVSNGQFDPVVTGIGTHQIIYTFTDGSGCTASDTSTVNVVSFSASIVGLDPVYCINGAAVPLTGSPTGGTFIVNGSTETSFDPSQAGLGNSTVQYNYSDAQGCSDTVVQTVAVNPAPVTGAISGPTTAQPFGSFFYDVVANNGSSYTWTAIGGTVNSSTGNIASITWAGGPAGQVSVVETDAQGCSDSSFLAVEIGFIGLDDDLLQGREFVLFPNPTSDRFTWSLRTQPDELVHYAVFGPDGRLVEGGEYVAKSHELSHTANVSEWAAGLYFVQVMAQDRSYFEKIFVR